MYTKRPTAVFMGVGTDCHFHTVRATCGLAWNLSKTEQLYEKCQLKILAIGECLSRSFKVTDIGASRQATYDFLLVFHLTIYPSRTTFEILTFCQNIRRSRDSEHTTYTAVFRHAYDSTFYWQWPKQRQGHLHSIPNFIVVNRVYCTLKTFAKSAGNDAGTHLAQTIGRVKKWATDPWS